MYKTYRFIYLIMSCLSIDFIAMEQKNNFVSDQIEQVSDNEGTSTLQETSSKAEDCCNDRCVCMCCPFLWLWIKYIEDSETF